MHSACSYAVRDANCGLPSANRLIVVFPSDYLRLP